MFKPKNLVKKQACWQRHEQRSLTDVTYKDNTMSTIRAVWIPLAKIHHLS